METFLFLMDNIQIVSKEHSLYNQHDFQHELTSEKKVFKKNVTMEVNGNQNSLVTNIFRNIFFCVLQRKVI